MVFSSFVFLFRFLPCILILYFIVPGCYKNIFRNLVLFLCSIIFYAWGEPVYIFLMLFSTVVDYINGGLTGYFVNRDKKSIAKIFVILSAVINLMLLGFFKYADFAISVWNSVTGMNVVSPNLALPIGISFYTFQTMSYTIDIYRKNALPEKNIINFGAYISMFPQLIAGPIVKYKDISVQLRERKTSIEKVSYGVIRFVTGLGKKVLLANQAGEIFSNISVYSQSQLTTVAAWTGILAYAFQIYFDFSGYSDMAIGLMAVFGFDINENFMYPYQSKSITEFWRRWHISLGTWFREYVYIPLGGNRKGKFRTYINILAVWFLTGLWHGASFNFIAWGLYFCVFLIFEKAVGNKILEKLPSFLQRIYAMLVVYFGWFLFAWQEIPSHRLYLKAMFGRTEVGIIDNATLYLLSVNVMLCIILFIGSTELPKKCAMFIYGHTGNVLSQIIVSVYAVFVLLLSVSYLVNGTYNPFLYFRF